MFKVLLSNLGYGEIWSALISKIPTQPSFMQKMFGRIQGIQTQTEVPVEEEDEFEFAGNALLYGPYN